MLLGGDTVPGPPSVSIHAPQDWETHPAPGMTQLKHGPSWCTITAINEPMYEMMHRDQSAASESAVPVTFGKNAGFRFRYAGPAMANISDYLLKVESGWVRVRLSLSDPLEDAELIEACFDSLRVSASME